MCCAVELQTLFVQESAVPAPVREIRLVVLRLLPDPSLPALTLGLKPQEVATLLLGPLVQRPPL